MTSGPLEINLFATSENRRPAELPTNIETSLIYIILHPNLATFLLLLNTVSVFLPKMHRFVGFLAATAATGAHGTPWPSLEFLAHGSDVEVHDFVMPLAEMTKCLGNEEYMEIGSFRCNNTNKEEEMKCTEQVIRSCDETRELFWSSGSFGFL